MPRFSWTSLRLVVAAGSLLIGPLGVHAEPSPAPGVHVVQDGETLSQIALDANTDVATIVTLNRLSDANALSVGQSLKLPSAAAPAATSSRAASYTIAEGDTLWDIAQRFGTTTDAIVQANQLDDPGRLSLGTVLTLPAGATPSSGSSAAGASTSAAAAAGARPVASAAAAAQPAATAVAAAAGADAGTSRRSVLVSYTVQPGETLTKIARQFSISADAIVQASGLQDANKIGVGAVLKVPLPAREHVVAAGETLRDIAAGEKVDLGSLIDFNQLDDPELIRVGQTLLLPQPATQQAAAVTSPAPAAAPAASATPSATATAAATATATPSPTAKPAVPAAPNTAATPTPTAKPSATPKPVPPRTVVTPPPGAPSEGLAGAGLKLLGSPYVWGGSSPSGFDCSGFVWYVAKQVGKSLSRGLFAQYASGSHPARDQLQVGDLVFFQNTFNPGLSHNGIYIGNGQFVHAADEDAGVTISSLNTAYWSSHWFGATRVP